MLKGVDTSPVVTAKVSAQGITLARQSLDESSSAYLCYDRMTSVIEGHRSFSVSVCGGRGGIQARFQRGGGSKRSGPPLEIEKQKKKSSGQILSYFTIFCYFFSKKYHFLSYFLSCPPPLKNWKAKKKGFQILGPPLTNSWTRASILLLILGWERYFCK